MSPPSPTEPGGLDALPLPSGLAPGVIVTLWESDTAGMLHAVQHNLDDVARVGPEGVMLHTDPQGLLRDAAAAVALLRGRVPRIRLWFGVGLDHVLQRAMTGDAQRARELAQLDQVKALAIRLGIECVVLDPEHEYKVHGQAGADFARDVVSHLAAPGHYVLAHSAYSAPMSHPDYPWRSFTGEGSAVQLELEQRYTERDHTTAAQEQAVITASLASTATAVSQGLFRRNLPVRPYYESARWDTSGPLSQLIAGSDLVCLWPPQTAVSWQAIEDAKPLRAARGWAPSGWKTAAAITAVAAVGLLLGWLWGSGDEE